MECVEGERTKVTAGNPKQSESESGLEWMSIMNRFSFLCVAWVAALAHHPQLTSAQSTRLALISCVANRDGSAPLFHLLSGRRPISQRMTRVMNSHPLLHQNSLILTPDAPRKHFQSYFSLIPILNSTCSLKAFRMDFVR
jgi:hypothetical protein